MCPNCQAPLALTRVLDTRTYDTVVMRRRGCLKCSCRFQTEEVFAGQCLARPGDFQAMRTAAKNGNEQLHFPATNG